MKRFVNLVQLMIIVAIIYPIYYVWDTDRVDEFCHQVKPGISQESLIELAESHHLSIVGPQSTDALGGQWVILVPARSSFSGYACEVKGAVETVAFASIIND